jgi:hypothetical protein
MLVEIDYTDKKRTKFVCDRCKTDLTIETRRAILVQEPKLSAKKKWDLCPSCFAKLCRGISKGV